MSDTRTPARKTVGETDGPKPFLKWPGGKRWFADNHSDLLPDGFKTYFEPFLGGGAMFFSLSPRKAVLSDMNRELMDVYRAVRDDWKEVSALLARHQKRHCRDHYYATREDVPDGLAGAAARFIYLNRTCFNGLYRVNRQGKFNVPMGTRDRVTRDDDRFDLVSQALRRATLDHGDFERIVDLAGPGDLVFADPPYVTDKSGSGKDAGGFVRYNKTIFSMNDQERLAAALGRARDRGAFVVCTNADHPDIRVLYAENGFRTTTVGRNGSMSADGQRRGRFRELVVTSAIPQP